MKLDGQTFKRIQRILTELSNIDLPEDELKEIAVAGIEAHRHRKSGTTFTEAQLDYRLRKNKTTSTTTANLADEIFRQIPLEEANLLAKGKIKGKEILGRTKLWFEEVPAKLKKGLNK